MPSTTYGIRFMEVRHLVESILAGDLLSAREWVADAKRQRLNWEALPYPKDLRGRGMTIAAGVIELLAGRAGENPPPWTEAIGAEPDPVVLDPGLEEMPRSFARAKTSAPEPLRKRNLVALPGFLDVA